MKEFECHNGAVSGRRCSEQCKDCKNMEVELQNNIKCCICHKLGKDVCDACNKIYSKTVGATFDTKEDIEHFFEYEDVPRHQLKKLATEMSNYLNC